MTFSNETASNSDCSNSRESYEEVTFFGSFHAVEPIDNYRLILIESNRPVPAEEEEVDSGIPAHRIIIGGFSQGGAMSLLTGMTSERKLGGVVVMSGWLPLRTKFKAVRAISSSIRSLPNL